MVPAGVIGGLTAAVFGFLDWGGIPSGTRASRVGMLHGLGNVLVVLLFAASWWTRSDAARPPSNSAFTFELLGTGLLLVTGWLGGELVVRLGVGVNQGAHVDAPSSLSTDNVAESTTSVRRSILFGYLNRRGGELYLLRTSCT